MDDTYDIIVIGGGMAGLPIAIRSARKELKTALVEQDLLGGTCLNRGCIPTKTMIRSAEVANLARRADEFGIDIEGAVETDMNAVVERQQSVVESIRTGAYDNVDDTDNLDLVEGHGEFESQRKLRSAIECSQGRKSSSTLAPGQRNRRSMGLTKWRP